MSTARHWKDHPDLVAFYSAHRSRPEDLYTSERRFLPWLARRCDSVLDVGCAAGGFSNIWRHYNPRIAYTGSDISRPLIEAARRIHPDLRFIEGDAASSLPLPDGYADVVQALGWLHWEPRYDAAVRELWRLAGRYLFTDVRLAAHEHEAAEARQKLALAGEWDGRTTVPYLVLAWPRFAALLAGLRPWSIRGYGYWSAVAETVVGVGAPVCMATFVLERARAADDERARPWVCLDTPLPTPPALGPFHALPASDLDALLR